MKPCLYHYTNYTQFLGDYYFYVKEKNKNWSYNAWAKSLGLKNNSSILKIVNGERQMGAQIQEKLIEYFKFNSKEKQYFLDLIQLSKIGKETRLGELIWSHLDKEAPKEIIPFSPEEPEALADTILPFLIFTILDLKSFDGKESSIMSYIKKTPLSVDNETVKVTIANMLRRKIIMKKEGLLCLPAQNTLNILEVLHSKGFSQETLKKAHIEGLHLAEKIIRAYPFEGKYLQSNSYTLTIKEEDYSPMRKEIDTFLRKTAEKYSAQTGQGEKIYHLNFQLIPYLLPGFE